MLQNKISSLLRETNESIFKGCRMGPSDKVSLWYVALLINAGFRFFILEQAIVERI